MWAAAGACFPRPAEAGIAQRNYFWVTNVFIVQYSYRLCLLTLPCLIRSSNPPISLIAIVQCQCTRGSWNCSISQFKYVHMVKLFLSSKNIWTLYLTRYEGTWQSAASLRKNISHSTQYYGNLHTILLVLGIFS